MTVMVFGYNVSDFKWYRICNLISLFFALIWFQFIMNEKIYQTPNRVFDQISKHVKVCQKCNLLHIVSCISTFFSVFGNGFKHSFCLIHIMHMEIMLNVMIAYMYVSSSRCCPFVVYWLSQSPFLLSTSSEEIYNSHVLYMYRYMNTINFVVAYVNVIAVIVSFHFYLLPIHFKLKWPIVILQFDPV